MKIVINLNRRNIKAALLEFKKKEQSAAAKLKKQYRTFILV